MSAYDHKPVPSKASAYICEKCGLRLTHVRDRKDREYVQHSAGQLPKPPRVAPEPIESDSDVVVLRRWKGRDGGDLIALFPDQREDRGLIGSYMHIGQHGDASWPVVIAQTRPVRSPDEEGVQELLAELRGIGYKPVLRQRRPAR